MKPNAGVLWETKLFYVVAVTLLLLGIAMYFSMRPPAVSDESASPPTHAPTR